MIQSQMVLHRFEAVMRRAGWVVRRLGPLRDRCPSTCGSQPVPRTLRWRVAPPNGSAELAFRVRAVQKFQTRIALPHGEDRRALAGRIQIRLPSHAESALSLAGRRSFGPPVFFVENTL